MVKRSFPLLIGVIAALLVAELLLRVLPVSTSTKTGYYIAPDLLTYPAHHHWTVATGWDLRNSQRLRSNNLGFAAEGDFFPNSDAVGLIGDSYVEASMLPPKERPAALLEGFLGGRSVYAMGAPGSSLLDYAERIRWANQALGLKDFVVMMENSDASQALCSSGNVHAHCLKPGSLEPTTLRRSSSSPLKDVLREYALAQYVNSQLKFQLSRLRSREFWNSGTPSEPLPEPPIAEPSKAQSTFEVQASPVVDAAVDVFLERLAAIPDIRVVFVIDMNREHLKRGLSVRDEGYHVAERLSLRGFSVVYGGPLFREHQRLSPLKLEIGPYDGHLNSLGLGLLMEAAAVALKKNSINAKEN